MSTKISNCAIAIGHLEGGDFGAAGQEGDWAVFRGRFTSGPKPIFAEVPRLIVTPILDDAFDFGAFPVCVLRDLSATEFTLAARNIATRGFAAFNWMAVRETPGITQPVPDVSIGVLSPLFFRVGWRAEQSSRNNNHEPTEHKLRRSVADGNRSEREWSQCGRRRRFTQRYLSKASANRPLW